MVIVAGCNLGPFRDFGYRSIGFDLAVGAAPPGRLRRLFRNSVLYLARAPDDVIVGHWCCLQF